MVAIITPHHLIAPATLPSPPDSLSVLSYNVLLPNSVDAWWTYKMYSPSSSLIKDDDDDVVVASSWSHRQNLLRERIALVDADVVCLQEVSPDSFEHDFEFMKNELGYDGVELFRKGRFRPATFWKTNKLKLVADAAHKDRTLLTAFETNTSSSSSTCEETKKQHWFVLNCHLQAGKQAQRRVRQIVEGTKAIVTMSNKLKLLQEEKKRIVICGDFNGGQECGAVRFLEAGSVDSDFREDGEPVTSSKKELKGFTVKDAMASFLERPPPPTMVVAELISQMVVNGDEAYENPVLSQIVIDRLERIFVKLASSKDNNGAIIMTVKDVEKWLKVINGAVGRGDEYREAAKQMGWLPPADAPDDMPHGEMKKLVKLPDDGVLTLEGFIAVYQRELRGGKFWGIAHDLAVLGEPLDDKGLFTARYDRMYCSEAVQPAAIIDFECNQVCPNAQEPSDHLPVAACFVPI